MELEGVHRQITKMVLKLPNKVAIEKGIKQRTYEELEEKSNKIANFLQSKFQEIKNIPVLFENSIELVEAMLGVLKCGSVFAPIDPNYPDKRIRLMLEEIEANWIITESRWLNHLNRIVEGDKSDIHIVVLDEGEFDRLEYKNLNIYTIGEVNKCSSMSHTHLSNKNGYIYFTSGSTGKPKAIMGRNKSLMHFIDWEIKEFGICENSRVSQLTSPSFDPFLRDTFVPLCAGATVCIPEDREIVMNTKKLSQWIEENQISLIHIVPTLFKSMMMDVEDANYFKDLKYVLLAGELLRGNDIKKFISLFGKRIQLVNLYGPTETTLAKVFYRIKEDDINHTSLPVGKPIDGAQVMVLNSNLKGCGTGSVGEIYIRTPFITSGYYNNKELTKEVFIKNPFSNNANDIIYKTGDTGRILPSGDLQIMGRIDHQVKIRGHRIELGEIENRLLSHPLVKEAVVVPFDDENQEKYLCGYIVSEMEVNPKDIREFLAMELPEYMIPAYIVQIDEMPLTPNGKVDRRALPQPDGNRVTAVEYMPPTNETEKQLVDIWMEILSVREIGVNDNFFQLGGHSLKATTMTAKIHNVFNIEVPLRVIFESPTISGIATCLQSMKKGISNSIESVGEREYYPVSSAQRRIYTLQQFNKSSIAYNMPGAVLLEGMVDKQKLEAVFNRLIQRHESLRTSFEIVDSEPVQIVHKEVEFNLEYFNETEENLQTLLDNFIKPFDLTKPYLFRVGLVTITTEKHLLIYDMHHIISDGTSLGIFIKDLQRLYAGKEIKPLKVQYKDYSVWQQKLFQSEKMQQQKEYWLKQFNDEIPVLNLIGDYPRPTIQSFEGERFSLWVDEKLTSNLKAICKEKEVTLYMLMLAAFNVLLSKYSSQEDIVVGSPIAGRSHGDLNNIMGMFVNTLAMRNYPKGEKIFEEFLEEVKINALNAYENQDFQFEELIKNLNLTRDISRNPLFDVMFIMQNIDISSQQLNGLCIKPFEIDKKISKMDMTLSAMEREEGIQLIMEYSTKIFKRETIEGFVGHFINILNVIVDKVDIKLMEVDILADKERHYLLNTFNNRKLDYDTKKTLQQIFEEQVETTPEEVAVVFENQQFTYRELNKKSNQLAVLLRKNNVKPNTVVGIMVEPSLEMLMGIMAIIKAGGSYLPIDPDYPTDRINYMLKDSGAELLLVQSLVEKKVKFKGKIIALDNKENYKGYGYNLENINGLNDLAYVLYTSGSTGKPKGVMLEHRSVVNFVHVMMASIPFLNSKSILALTTMSFDIFVLETVLPLLNGLRVVIASKSQQINPKALKKLMESEKVDILQATPSRMKLLMTDDGDFKVLSNLKEIILGGEVLPKTLYKEIREKTKANIYNGYGPTETTVYATLSKITDEDITIGRPLSNTQIYILNENNKLQPVGVVGEICIGGEGLARGYLNNPELTAEKFVDNPFVTGEKIYKTGDLGRWLMNGDIEYIGRIDHQVKIRGYRIELGEIENSLLKYEGIGEAVVMERKDLGGNSYLCAYISGNRALTVAEVRQHLSKVLPEYMLPSHIIYLEKMPLTKNGKLNRRELPAPDDNTLMKAEYKPPRNDLERKLVEMWQEILGVEKIGIHDNFFELGGHSINATMLSSKIQKEFNVEIPLMVLFKMPTIQEIAERINLQRYILKPLNEQPLLLMNMKREKNVFALPPYPGYATFYFNLAKHINTHSLFGFDIMEDESILERYVDYILEVQKEGPFVLLGYSVGGNLAFETAKVLNRRGYTVSDIIMLDALRINSDDAVAQLESEENKKNFEEIASSYINRQEGLESMGVDTTEIVNKAYYNGQIVINTVKKYLNDGCIDANIHIIKVEGTNFTELTSWQPATSGKVIIYKGKGPHNKMLHEESLAENAKIVKEILEGIG